MDKLIYTGDQDELVKVAGRIVTFFEDRGSVKSASACAFSEDMMQQCMPDDRHYGAHLIAMGDGENYGFNKNGDFWTRDGLQRRYDTFKKHGHYFLEHENHDPKLKYGDVKAAAWNDAMHRVELIIHANKDKDAEGYEAAKSGKVLTYSMSARVPGDWCSCCDHFAKRSSDYCDHAKRHMTQWMPKFEKFAYVINRDPTFFDISRVGNRADRIALRIKYMFNEGDALEKAASAQNDFLFSDVQAKLAGVQLPIEDVLGCSTPERQYWLEKLAAAEEYIWQAEHHPDNVAKDQKYQFLKHAAIHAFDPRAVSDVQLELMRTLEPDVLFRGVAKRASILPPIALYCYVNGGTVKAATADPIFQLVERQLPYAMRKALTKQADAQIENLFTPSCDEKADLSDSDPITKMMDQVGEDFSIEKPVVKQRALRICLACPSEKQASVKPTEEQKRMADVFTYAYTMYKVAAVEAIAKLRGNSFIDDATSLMLAFNPTVETESK